MIIPQGPWYIDDTLTFTVTTHRFDTGALTDADSVPAYRIYEDETGTAILTGNMAKLDDTNTTGFYSEQVTLSAANGFEVGKSYAVYVTATVNSVSGGQSGSFKMSGNHPANVTQFGGTNGTFSSGRPEVNTTHAAGTAWNSGAITDNTLASAAITSAKFAANALDAVWSTASRLLTAGTNIVLAKGTGVTGFNDLSAAQVNAEADTALSDVGLTTTITGRIDVATSTRLATAGYTTPPTVGEIADAVLEESIPAHSGVTDSLAAFVEAINGYAEDLPTEGAIANAVWDEAVDGSVTARESLRLANSANGGKVSGAGTTNVLIRDLADSKNRVDATVDVDGNRSAVTRDLT